jgi:hypothetical protein
MTTGDKIFGIIAIILGIAIVVVALLGVLVTPWVVIGASSLAIAWMTVARRRLSLFGADHAPVTGGRESGHPVEGRWAWSAGLGGLLPRRMASGEGEAEV